MNCGCAGSCGCSAAESSPLPPDPRVSPLTDGLHIPADSPSLDLPRENAEIGGVDFMAESKFDKLAKEIAEEYEEKGKSPKEAMEIGEATAAKIGRAKFGKKKFAKMGQKAESFEAEKKVWDEGTPRSGPYVFPKRKAYPIGNETHGKLALIYSTWPDNKADAPEVRKKVFARYPELRKWFEDGKYEHRAENLAVQDVEVQHGTTIPDGSGQVMGQTTPTTNFTPFGVSAESFGAETFGAEGKCQSMETGKYGNHKWMGGPIKENSLMNDYETVYGTFGIYCDKCGQEAYVSFDVPAEKFIEMCQSPYSREFKDFDLRGAEAYGAESPIPTRIEATQTQRGVVQTHDSIPAGDGHVVGQYTPDMDYAPSGMYAESHIVDSIQHGFGAVLGVLGGLIVAGSAMNAVSRLSQREDN